MATIDRPTTAIDPDEVNRLLDQQSVKHGKIVRALKTENAELTQNLEASQRENVRLKNNVADLTREVARLRESPVPDYTRLPAVVVEPPIQFGDEPGPAFQPLAGLRKR